MREHGYYLSTDHIEIPIITWDSTKIIAVHSNPLCYTNLLSIDLRTEEVILKSKFKNDAQKSHLCNDFKDKTLLVYTLVDETKSKWIYSVKITKKEKNSK